MKRISYLGMVAILAVIVYVATRQPAPMLHSVSIEVPKYTLYPGSTAQLSARVRADAGIAFAVKWETGDSRMASVDSLTGLVSIPKTATSGEVTVTAVATDGRFYKTGKATLFVGSDVLR